MVDKQQLNFCNPVGMLLRIQVDPQVDFDINSLPFGSDICIIAAFVDPRFKFQWVETYVDLHQDEVQALLTNLHSVVRALVETTDALYKCNTLTSAGESTSTSTNDYSVLL